MKGGVVMPVSVVAKIKLLPTQEQSDTLLKTMRAYADACNYVSEYIFNSHVLSKDKLNKALYRSVRDKFGFGAQMAQSVLRTVVAKYKSIRINEKIWLKPDFRHPQCDLVWNRDYSLKKDAFSINTLYGRLKIPYVLQGMEQYFDKSLWRFGTAKVIFKRGKWHLYVSVTNFRVDVDEEALTNVVGIDLGINFLATAYGSNGKTVFYSGKKVKHKRGLFAKTRKDLQKRQTPSARRRLKRIGDREHRWMQDVNHCVSKALVANYPNNTLFVLEDLGGIRNATEKVLLKNRYVAVSWSFYDLRKKIEYKATLQESKAIAVDPAYTSQKCPVCGHTEKRNRDKKNHIFGCKECGYKSNDDRIGAINLYYEGIKYLNAVV